MTDGRKRIEGQVWAMMAIALILLIQTLQSSLGLGGANQTRESIVEIARQQTTLLQAMSEQLKTANARLEGIERHNDLIRETYGYGPSKIADEVERRLRSAGGGG